MYDIYYNLIIIVIIIVLFLAYILIGYFYNNYKENKENVYDNLRKTTRYINKTNDTLSSNITSSINKTDNVKTELVNRINGLGTNLLNIDTRVLYNTSNASNLNLKFINDSNNLNNFDTNLKNYFQYKDGATVGLDPGKDAGLFNGTPSSFSLFTRLIEDNGVDFTVQVLPDNNFENMVVPVGLVAAKGATITFKATATNLPSGYEVVLEDRESGTFTRLDEVGNFYSVALNAASNGTGRFYLHTSEIVSAIDETLLCGVKVVPNPEQHLVRIVGNFDLPARAMIYDMNGKLVTTSMLTSQIENDISLTNCSTGVYLLRTESGKGVETVKFVWNRK
jgi:hypothetical protein